LFAAAKIVGSTTEGSHRSADASSAPHNQSAAKGKKRRDAMSDEACAAVLSRAPLLRSLHAAEIDMIVAHGVRRVHCPTGKGRGEQWRTPKRSFKPRVSNCSCN
jgi:hypothetical protein